MEAQRGPATARQDVTCASDRIDPDSTLGVIFRDRQNVQE